MSNMIEITEEKFFCMIADFMEAHFEQWEVMSHRFGVTDIEVHDDDVSIFVGIFGFGKSREIMLPVSAFAKDGYECASKQIKEEITKAFANEPTLIAKFPSYFTRPLQASNKPHKTL